jgi:hypothetical protein
VLVLQLLEFSYYSLTGPRKILNLLVLERQCLFELSSKFLLKFILLNLVLVSEPVLELLQLFLAEPIFVLHLSLEHLLVVFVLVLQ